MFEYLMPALLMRSAPGSLLARSGELAVRAQMDRGEAMGAPWAVSESGYAKLDGHDGYQYRSFGVPGLGLRRGLDEDRVVAPYASMLAVSLRPRDVVSNLRRLDRLGGVGELGLYEALDYSPTERSDAPETPAVVKSHMAHHQGMIL